MKALKEYLSAEHGAAMALSEELRREERGDEAVFEKVRANVFDIFRTVAVAAEKQHAHPAEARAFFLRKLREIPAVWRQSAEAAGQHGDEGKKHLEAVKLAAAGEIGTWLLKNWGGDAL